LPPEALDALDNGLATELECAEGDRFHRECLIAARQSIAEAKGDLDGLIALETSRSAPNTHFIAERLLKAGRAQEALKWAKQKQHRTISFMRASDIADGAIIRDWGTIPKVKLEAKILEALGDKSAAQELRWSAFEATLDADILREHVAALDDFAEFETMDRAFAVAKSTKSCYAALDFLLSWPNLDQAAELVILHRKHWSGAFHKILLEAADALERAHPVAATILYRALLDDILEKSKNKAYAHGAVYFQALEDLTPRFTALPGIDIENPPSYRAGIQKIHGRKSGFWSLLSPQ
jgi:hypothetical protein